MSNAPFKKTAKFAYDKILPTEITHDDNLEAWANLYFRFHVIGSSEHTIRAKKNDLSKFLSYLQDIGGGRTRPDNWTPSVTKSFQRFLLEPSATNKEGMWATSVNRIMATLSHFSRWLLKQRPLLAGDPFQGVRTVTVDSPAWNGLDANTVTRLKMACNQRLKICTRKNQNPLMEGAVFYILLGTGLRESELIELMLAQYHHRGFHQVKRKGNKVTRKVSVPSEAKDWLDRYLETRD